MQGLGPGNQPNSRLKKCQRKREKNKLATDLDCRNEEHSLDGIFCPLAVSSHKTSLLNHKNTYTYLLNITLCIEPLNMTSNLDKHVPK